MESSLCSCSLGAIENGDWTRIVCLWVDIVFAHLNIVQMEATHERTRGGPFSDRGSMGVACSKPVPKSTCSLCSNGRFAMLLFSLAITSHSLTL